MPGYIVINSQIKSGNPVMRGTRFTVAQLLHELAEGHTVESFANAYDYDVDLVKRVLFQLGDLVNHLDVAYDIILSHSREEE